ncbi:MAG: glycoside hydrolase family 2 protein [Candidatus Sulfotelmatobacter sp.]
MHNLQVPVAPRIEATLSRTGDDYSITLQSSKLARNVYLSFGDLDVECAENYFDLLPSEPITIHLKSSATLEQPKAALTTTSLTEAFNSN